METNPLVSVVMATYNEPVHYIKESIESILNQTYSNLELIIADDSTNKDTIDTIDSYLCDSRVVLIRKSQRMGFVPALNEGLRAAKGEFIARMDGDDISLPDRIQIQVDFLLSNRNCSILGGAMNIIDEHSKISSMRSYPEGGLKLIIWQAFRDPFGHPTVMFRSTVLKEMHYDETMKYGNEDTEFWLRLRNRGYKFHNLKIPILNYRIIGDMALKRKKDQRANYIARLKNFSVKFILLDIISIISLMIRDIIPTSMMTMIYKYENNK